MKHGLDRKPEKECFENDAFKLKSVFGLPKLLVMKYLGSQIDQM